MKPRLLDLFCGPGAIARGYAAAGWEVVGVDINSQPRYPFTFAQMDALEVLERIVLHGAFTPAVPICRELENFQAIHASPPCPFHSSLTGWGRHRAVETAEVDLIPPLRELLIATGLPYVIENVVGAPLHRPVVVCGLSLGLGVKRHRLFEANVPLMVPPCVDDRHRDYYVVFGHEVRNRRHGSAAGRKNKIAEGRKAMGIDWMTRAELSEAIPPAYTELIGHQLLAHIRAEAVA